MTIAELTQVRDSGTEPGYRVEGNRLAAKAALRCRIRERGIQQSVAADGVRSVNAGAGRGSMRLAIAHVNPQTALVDLDDLVELTVAADAAEDRP